jgi:phosphatidylserine decarboxylase
LEPATDNQAGELPRPAPRFGRRLAAHLHIAAEGLPFTLGTAATAILALIAGLRWIGALIFLAALAVAAFFRDPERIPAAAEGAFIAGADGRVTDIGESPMPGRPGEEIYRRVAVFMSPLNVHVNRAPASGEIAQVLYTPGAFRAAFRDDASEHNERNLIAFADGKGRRFGMLQVAGYLARRIVCHVRPGQQVARGQRVGMIMFGSRVDHFMPRNYRVAVAIGDRVRAGKSIIGELSDES